MFDAALRSHKERLLGPVARLVAPRVGPTAITILACAIGLAAAAAAAAGLVVAAVALWLANRALDGLDGAVARRRRATSAGGGYLDMLLDVVVYTAIPIGIAVHLDTAAAWIAVAVLLGAFYVNAISWAYLSALLEARGEGAQARGEMTAVTMPRGVVEGAETLVLFTIALAVPAWSVAVMWVMSVAVLLGAVLRAAWGLRRLGGT